MGWLTQLMDQAKSLYRDMTSTQRITIFVMTLGVAVVLAFVASLGSYSQDAGSVPIMQAEAADVNDIKDKLETGGFGPIQYSDGKIWVPLDKSKQAVLFLAEESMLPKQNEMGFDEMFQMWDFVTPRERSNKLDLIARGNMVARLVEEMRPIKA
ncbi:MAG: hypothetical protein JXR97_16020, partial [Planctomycetes bacterium]|nr:hypothetical protein [Planctomycetota bacterium]